MQEVFLGIDIGTTAIKFGVFREGRLMIQRSATLKTFSGENGARYQSAQEILAKIRATIRQLPDETRRQVTSLSVSAPMHSCWPITSDSDTSDAIFIWSDRQAQDLMTTFKQSEAATTAYLKTGTPIHPMSPYAKIKYFRHVHRYATVKKWWGIKELVLRELTGHARIDDATASATGLFNLRSHQWDPEILEELQISPDQLGEIVACTDVFPILPAIAAQLGLDQHVKIYAGASDGCLAAYAGNFSTGIANSLTIGTSAAVRQVSSAIKLDPKRENFCYYLQPGQYVVGAPSNNGGNVLAWASQQFARSTDDFFERLPQWLADSPIGANGVRFMPFLNGERAPYWDATKKAAFKNMTAATSQADLVRSVIEGTLLNIRALVEMVGATEQITLSGGFFKSQVLRELTVDIIGLDGYISAANEPIAGLYDLIYPEQRQKIAAKEKVAFQPAVHQQYVQLARHYFDD